ncbi:UvrB/UvrC motif-containing protein [bacterium]|nr:UvrB/UvrC motif-containing protein [bacterium]
MARKRIEIESLADRSELFGKSVWSNGLGAVSYTQLHGTKKAIRERIREECPAVPGVYGMLSSEGHVVYVGMSSQLPKRLQSYFSTTTNRKKETRIRRHAVGVLWQPTAHPFLAQLRERQLIGRFHPPLNIQGQPVKMQTGYIVANLNEAPSFQLVTEIPKTHDGVWGPIPYHSFSIAAIEQLNLQFGLRDCPKNTVMQFKGEQKGELLTPPSCLRIDLQTCLRPCLGACSKKEYTKAFDSAKKFLNGHSKKLFSDLQKQMQSAAENRHFEKAAKLRDRAKAFEQIDSHLRRFHDWSSQASFVYRLDSEIDQQELWLIVIRGIIIDLINKPQSPEDKESVTELVDQSQRQLNGNAAAKNVSQPGEFEAARALFHWFNKFPEEVKRQYSLKKAVSLCNRKLKNAS